MVKTATHEAMIVNLRKNRAMALVGAILNELQKDDRFPNEHLSSAHDAMAEVFIRSGAYFMTDQDRAEMGLEPRDFLGWTPSERLERKERERNALLSMMGITTPLKEPKA